MSACLNPRCAPGRSQPAHGCSCWQLDPDRAHDAKPVADPPAVVMRAFRRWRDGLEAVFERANGSLQPWDACRYVIDRDGSLGPPVRGAEPPCACHLPADDRSAD